MFARATPVPAAHVIGADADVVMMFDKQQVLRRTWINRLYKVYYEVLTNVAVLYLSPPRVPAALLQTSA
jgi:hypothetical protein